MVGGRRRAGLGILLLALVVATTWLVLTRVEQVVSQQADVPGTVTPVDGFTARDQWIALRGGEPTRTTPVARPTGRLDLRVSLLQRDRLGGRHRVHRDRPPGFAPTAIVLHATGSGEPGSGFGSLDDLERFFARPTARASAHFGVDRQGGIVQLVDLDDAAFHVATPGWNDISIGIELLNDNAGERYPEAQLAALTQLVRALATAYDIPVEGVVRHATVQPGDRRDPVGFPWRTWLATLPAPRTDLEQ